MRITSFGDTALLVEFEHTIDVMVNLRVLAAGDAYGRRRSRAFGTWCRHTGHLPCYYDPLSTDVSLLREVVARAAAAAAASRRPAAPESRRDPRLLRRPLRAGSRRGSRVGRHDAHRGRRRSCFPGVPGVHAGIPARVSLHGEVDRANRDAAAQYASHAGPGWLGGHRWPPDRCVSRLTVRADGRSSAARHSCCSTPRAEPSALLAPDSSAVPAALRSGVRRHTPVAGGLR